MHAVHLDKVAGDIDQRHRPSAVEPVIRRDLFRVIEDEFAAADIRGTEEEFLDGETRVAFNAETWEELEEETRGAVEEDAFWTEVEIGVVGLGLGIALGHVKRHVGKVEVTASCGSHHAEEGTIKGEVVRFGEEVIRASEGGVCFEFLQQHNKSIRGQYKHIQEASHHTLCASSPPSDPSSEPMSEVRLVASQPIDILVVTGSPVRATPIAASADARSKPTL